MKLSVITPSLNQARYLGQCLASVRTAAAQAKPHDVEQIVIDGGSSDGSVELLRGHDDIRWISEPDRGQSNAINKGLAMADGDILAYLCADDLYEPHALSRVFEVFASDAAADVVYADFYFLEGDSGRKRRKSAASFRPDRLRSRNPLGQPAV